MASEKRAASGNYSQMVVKRPNLGNNNSKALATVNGSSANGALVQAVSLPTLPTSGLALNCYKNGRLTLVV